MVAAFTLLWALLALFADNLRRSVFPHMAASARPRFASRIVGTTHSVVSCAMGCAVVGEVLWRPRSTVEPPSTMLTVPILVELGYYSWDTVSDIITVTTRDKGATFLDLLWLLHHVVPMAAGPALILFRETPRASGFIDLVTACFMVTNLPTAVLHSRWLAEEAYFAVRQASASALSAAHDGGKDGANGRRELPPPLESLSLALRLVHVVSYVVCRVLIWPWVFWLFKARSGLASILLVPTVIPLKCSISTFILALINAYWCWLCIKNTFKAFRRRRQRIAKTKSHIKAN